MNKRAAEISFHVSNSQNQKENVPPQPVVWFARDSVGISGTLVSIFKIHGVITQKIPTSDIIQS
jgi:hypothetical protein